MRVAVKIVLSDEEVPHLGKLSKSRSVSVRLAERSQIVLLAGKSRTNEEIAEALGVTRQKAGRWRQRYAEWNRWHQPGRTATRAANRRSSSRKFAQVIRLLQRKRRRKMPPIGASA
ncbi:MAG: helix-turn-helix domain-containing protein [Gammaproteobacteria bacterium]|nr:helix-turn-helix domain-containing protein [Gammaproteobacteria bacterium]